MRKSKRPVRNTLLHGSSEPRRKVVRARGLQLRSEWMRGLRGCLVFWKPHHDNYKNPPGEVSEAIRKLKNLHHTYMMTVKVLDTTFRLDEDE